MIKYFILASLISTLTHFFKWRVKILDETMTKNNFGRKWSVWLIDGSPSLRDVTAGTQVRNLEARTKARIH